MTTETIDVAKATLPLTGKSVALTGTIRVTGARMTAVQRYVPRSDYPITETTSVASVAFALSGATVTVTDIQHRVPAAPRVPPVFDDYGFLPL